MVIFSASQAFALTTISNTLLGEDDLAMAKIYLPYCMLSYFGRQHSTCYAITHFAQTLDGRIASASGDSKWIGNDENLIHAHRMRALCDSIVVGAKTVEIDNPRLNVRLVNGSNPVKVVVGGKDLDRSAYHAYDDTSIVFCENGQLADENGTVTNKKHYQPREMLEQLCQKKCYSAYIEGGSNTSSLFFKNQCIDQVQIHISPKILGSGVTGFNFEGVDNMEQVLEFDPFDFIKVGDHIMFVGEPKRNR
jgi:diaminohydroxyphosphoribosylaminopyrimidine deaminase/5-amino-6-(5-phosphoribosylamino)uracil reductase